MLVVFNVVELLRGATQRVAEDVLAESLVNCRVRDQVSPEPIDNRRGWDRAGLFQMLGSVLGDDVEIALELEATQSSKRKAPSKSVYWSCISWRKGK